MSAAAKQAVTLHLCTVYTYTHLKNHPRARQHTGTLTETPNAPADANNTLTTLCNRGTGGRMDVSQLGCSRRSALATGWGTTRHMQVPHTYTHRLIGHSAHPLLHAPVQNEDALTLSHMLLPMCLHTGGRTYHQQGCDSTLGLSLLLGGVCLLHLSKLLLLLPRTQEQRASEQLASIRSGLQLQQLLLLMLLFGDVPAAAHHCLLPSDVLDLALHVGQDLFQTLACVCVEQPAHHHTAHERDRHRHSDLAPFLHSLQVILLLFCCCVGCVQFCSCW